MESNPTARVTIEQIKEIDDYKYLTNQECEQIIEQLEQLAYLFIEHLELKEHENRE